MYLFVIELSSMYTIHRITRSPAFSAGRPRRKLFTSSTEISSHEECSKAYKSGFTISYKMLCAFDYQGIDSCEVSALRCAGIE